MWWSMFVIYISCSHTAPLPAENSAQQLTADVEDLCNGCSVTGERLVPPSEA